MKFKQKAEEKKMSMSKNIARLAVTAGLTAALSFGGVMAPVTMAFAAEGGQGSIKINKVADNNATNTFKAYQIFKAKVVDEKGKVKVASDINWANDTIGSKVTTAIMESTEYKALVKKDATKGLKDGASASDVAEWLSQNVEGTASTASSSEGTRVAPGDVLYEIAAAVSGKKQGVEAETAAGDLEADNSWTRPDDYGDGYYLFVPDGLTDSNKPNTGTSPIFAIVGGNPVTVTEKTSIPTVDKEILKSGANAAAMEAKSSDRQFNQFNNCGDSQIGQEVSYRLTGTVADNIASYVKYEYEFHDTLSKGLVVTKGEDGTPKDLHVYIVNDRVMYEVKSGFKATVDPAQDTAKNSELLTVKFDDLKAVKDEKDAPISVDKYSEVVVTYKAQLTSDASYEATGNTNTVKLVYSNNPMAEGTGTSVEKTVTDHVFCLDVTKVDKDNPNKKLEAGFKVQVAQNDDEASVGRWLASDGSLVKKEGEAYEFKTDSSTGEIRIPGLDAGTYRIVETTTPSGYNTIKPFHIQIMPEYDPATGKLTNLTVRKDSDFVEANFDRDASIPVTIKNKKGSGLPLTGLNGVTFTWIAGGAVLCIGVAHLIRSRKRVEESEQE